MTLITVFENCFFESGCIVFNTADVRELTDSYEGYGVDDCSTTTPPIYQQAMHEKSPPSTSPITAPVVLDDLCLDNNLNKETTQEPMSLSSDSALLQSYEQSGDTGTSLVSSDAFETEIQCDKDVFNLKEVIDENLPFDESVSMEEKDRLKSSSYEDIYTDVKAPLEDEEIIIPLGPIEVGDRFEGKHIDSPFIGLSEGKTSSFENLYEASSKEAEDVDDKDVDERDLDSDSDRPEKGEGEDEKYYVQSPPQMYMSTRTEPDSSLELDLIPATQQSGSPQIGRYTSPPPIDVTLESGLDQVGHEGEDDDPLHLGGSRQKDDQRDSLERSHSYEVGHEHDDTSDRQRHFSTPDEVLHMDIADEHVGKGI